MNITKKLQQLLDGFKGSAAVLRATDFSQKWIVTAVVVIDFISMNLYRWFERIECPVEKAGDKLYHIGEAIAWELLIIALIFRNNDTKDKAILSGYCSLGLNNIFDEVFGDPSKVTWLEITFACLISFGVASAMKLELKWKLVIMGCIILLGSL